MTAACQGLNPVEVIYRNQDDVMRLHEFQLALIYFVVVIRCLSMATAEDAIPHGSRTSSFRSKNQTMLLKLLLQPGFARPQEAIEGIFVEVRGEDDRNDTFPLRHIASVGMPRRDPEIMEHVLRTQSHKLKARQRRRRRRRRRRHPHRKGRKDQSRRQSEEIGEKGNLSKVGGGGSDPLARVIREGWCRAVRMRQTVAAKGCIPAHVENHLCYGQCNSFYIPQVNGSTPFKSCPFCTPVRKKTEIVNLICPHSESPIKPVKVLKVLKCKCKIGLSNI